MEHPTTYRLPEHLEPYRHLIGNTGGNRIEELVDDFNNVDHLSRTNVVRFTQASMVFAQIQLLETLHRRALLPRTGMAHAMLSDDETANDAGNPYRR
jgi:hypothetical protein